MDRRTLLRRGLPVALAGLAGCTGDGNGDGGDTDDDGGGAGAATASDSPTPTRTDTDAQTAPSDTDPGPGTERSTTTPTGPDEPTTTPTTDRTSTPTGTDEPTTTTTPEPDQRVVVAPGGEFRFEPEEFTVERGDTVLWVWEGTGHNVSDGATPEGSDWSGDDETTYAAGHTYAYTFEVAGAYEYHCDPHRSLGMAGSFTVT